MVTPAVYNTSALIVELMNDSASIGYAPFIVTRDSNSLSDLLNIARSGGSFLVNRAPVSPSTVFNNIHPDDFSTLNTTDLARLQTIFSLEEVDLSVSASFEKLTAIFSPGAPTLLTLTTLKTREGSRAEVLWGPGTIVTPNEVSEALESF